MNSAVSAIGRAGRGLRIAWPHDAAAAWLAAWIDRERGRFAPWLTVFMGIGVVGYFSLRAEPAAWAGAVGAAAALAAAAAVWQRRAARAAALALLAAAIGFGSAQWAAWRAPPVEALPRTAVIITGIVRGVDLLPDGRRVTVGDVRLGGGEPLERTVRVRLRTDDPAAVAAGDAVSVRAVLQMPSSPAYPGAWDLQRDAFFSGLAASGRALGPVTIARPANAGGVARWLRGVRDGVAARIMAALPGTEGAIAATLLTGAGTAIPPADRAAFRDSGLAHLLAVAGLHIGIVMGLTMGIARLLLALSERAALDWPCKAVAAAAALSAGGVYLLLTGGHVPILRSFAMAALVTLGIALGRRALSLRGLALAGAAIMLAAPQEVVGVGFQMSFAAVAALIAGYEAMRPALARLHGPGWRLQAGRYAAALVLTSLLAGIASAPFAAYHFGHVQTYFILANLVAVPLTAAWVMPAGMAALALMPLGLEQLALTPMGWGIDAVLWIARSVSALPAATVGVPHMPIWGIAAVALGLAWLCLWRTPVRLAGAGVITAGLLSGIVSPPADLLVSSDGRLLALDGARAALQTRPGYARFTLDAWRQYWADDLAAPFPEADGPGRVRCEPDGCRIAVAVSSRAAAVWLARSMRAVDCAGIVLVVAAEPARAVCPGAPRIDRYTVWRDGAHAVWFGRGGVTVLSDRADRGDRPWVPPPPFARGATTLPMAQAE